MKKKFSIVLILTTMVLVSTSFTAIYLTTNINLQIGKAIVVCQNVMAGVTENEINGQISPAQFGNSDKLLLLLLILIVADVDSDTITLFIILILLDVIKL